MAEHCSECQGTGKLNRKACLHCAGTGIEPIKGQRFGPFRVYPTFKRDLIILGGLFLILLIFNIIL